MGREPRFDRKTDDLDPEWVTDYVFRKFSEEWWYGDGMTVDDVVQNLSAEEWRALRAAHRKRAERQTLKGVLWGEAMKHFRAACAKRDWERGFLNANWLTSSPRVSLSRAILLRR